MENSLTMNEVLLMLSALIPLIIAVITLIHNAVQARKQYKLDFFKEFTHRYQEILLASDGEQMDSRGIPKRIVMYFNLCSEEFYLHRQGYILPDVWNFWKEGMRSCLSSSDYQSAWVVCGADYNAEFKSYIDELLAEMDALE